MDAFKPPEYLASLIASINDGAKAAQKGALAMAVLGIYLLAVAFSTTDEDLLLGHTTAIEQLGVQVSPQISFGIAPWVFVALHAFALIRYDMLGVNLRHFLAELQETVPLAADRERCRQLLANVEFVAALAAPAGSGLHSRLFGWVAPALIVVFPVGVLLAVQISALRYQSDAINWMQRGALLADLLVLVWFLRRQRVADGGARRRWRARWARLLLAPALVVLVNAFWLGIPGPAAMTVGERWWLERRVVLEPDATTVWLKRLAAFWEASWEQPLDLILCPATGWGCRYLTVDHRTLVGRVWRPEAIAELRAGKGGDRQAAQAAVEGTFLRGRTLRFADLSESALYGADLIDANLTRADLTDAHLTGAHLESASLGSANLIRADLTDAHLTGAHLEGASLGIANLTGAHLEGAHLEGANLTGAHLTGADLVDAHLAGAHLDVANLTGVDMSIAHLVGAHLTGTNMEGANLAGADLTGAHLENANLIGSNVTQQQLNVACGNKAKLPAGLSLRPCDKSNEEPAEPAVSTIPAPAALAPR
jgi:uncharacterized protein YjbI with pentapeptide repeats